MKNKPLFYFYAFSVILMMCYSNNMLFTWYIPRMVIIVLSIIAPLMYMSFTKCDNRVPNVLLCLLWAIIIMYVVFTRRIFSFISLFRKIGELLCVISVILLPSEQKKELLRIVTLCLTIIIAISLDSSPFRGTLASLRTDTVGEWFPLGHELLLLLVW